MPYYTYILKCSDDSYYTGFTDSLDSRVEEHNLGIIKTAYTFKRRPVKLVFFQAFETIKAAKAFERQIKGWRREKKEALIDGRWDLLPELAKKKGKD